jgi:hypothetical protein
MNRAVAFAACGAVVLLSSAATAAPAGAIDICQKDADAWKDAYNKRDAEALASMYNTKTGMYSNEFWTAIGHDALLAGFKQQLAAGGHSSLALSPTPGLPSSGSAWSRVVPPLGYLPGCSGMAGR